MSSAKILVIDDEQSIINLVSAYLQKEGYTVFTATDGPAGLHAARTLKPDLIVLDIMLPGMDGLAVCRELRARGHTMPILMLTARDAISDRVTGLDAGADDYLVKPFAIEELTARLRALARREGPSKTPQLQVGDLTLDTATKRARRGDKPVERLTSKEYILLETLMHHPGQVLTRDQIIDHVWNMEFESDSKLIEVYISSLRKKIDAGHDLKLIQTVRGLGYRISADE